MSYQQVLNALHAERRSRWFPVSTPNQKPQPWVHKPLAIHSIIVEDDTPITAIIAAACDYYGISMGEMESAQRCSRIVIPRHVAMYLARKNTTLALPAIGRRFGNRDHTSVLNAVRRIAARIGKDPEFAAQVKAVAAKAKVGGVE